MELVKAARKRWWRSGPETASFRKWILVGRTKTESRLAPLVLFLTVLITQRSRCYLRRPFEIWGRLNWIRRRSRPFCCWLLFVARLRHGRCCYRTCHTCQVSKRYQNFPCFILRCLVGLILLIFRPLFREHDLRIQFDMHSSLTGKKS